MFVGSNPILSTKVKLTGAVANVESYTEKWTKLDGMPSEDFEGDVGNKVRDEMDKIWRELTSAEMEIIRVWSLTQSVQE